MPLKKGLSFFVAAALFLLSPGLPAYQAWAQVLEVPGEGAGWVEAPTPILPPSAAAGETGLAPAFLSPLPALPAGGKSLAPLSAANTAPASASRIRAALSLSTKSQGRRLAGGAGLNVLPGSRKKGLTPPGKGLAPNLLPPKKDPSGETTAVLRRVRAAAKLLEQSDAAWDNRASHPAQGDAPSAAAGDAARPINRPDLQAGQGREGAAAYAARPLQGRQSPRGPPAPPAPVRPAQGRGWLGSALVIVSAAAGTAALDGIARSLAPSIFGFSGTAAVLAVVVLGGVLFPVLVASRVELARVPSAKAAPYRRAFDALLGVFIGAACVTFAQLGLPGVGAQLLAHHFVAIHKLSLAPALGLLSLYAGLPFAYSTRTIPWALENGKTHRPTLPVPFPFWIFLLNIMLTPGLSFVTLSGGFPALGFLQVLFPVFPFWAYLLGQGFLSLLTARNASSSAENAPGPQLGPEWSLKTSAPGRRPDPVRRYLPRALGWLGSLAGGTVLLVALHAALGGSPMPPLFAEFAWSLLTMLPFFALSGLAAILLFRAKREKSGAFVDMVRDLAGRAGLPMPRVYISSKKDPNAFATGPLHHLAVVAATAPILKLMDERELRGVMGHELSHVKYRHTLAFLVALPMLQLLSLGYSNLAQLMISLWATAAWMLAFMAVSRTNEFMADEGGAKVTGDPLGLASGLRKLALWQMEQGKPREGWFSRVFSSHPPTLERVKRLKELAGENPKTLSGLTVLPLGLAMWGPLSPTKVVAATFLGHTTGVWIAAGAVAAGSWLLAKAARSAAARVLKKSNKDILLQDFLVSLAGVLAYASAGTAIAVLLGMSLPALLNGFGIVSAAASLALRGPISNLSGGISLAQQRPFRVGERIQVDSYQGVVKNITLTQTTLENRVSSPAGGEQVEILHVPNAVFIDYSILRFASPATADPSSSPPASGSAGRAAWLIALLPIAAALVAQAFFHYSAAGLTALAVAGASYLAAQLVRRLAVFWLKGSNNDPLFNSIIVTAAGCAVYLLGAFSAAAILGVQLAALLESLGLTSIAAGFALRGPLGNLFGGLSLLNDRSFGVGDRVRVGANAAAQGTVTKINLSYTHLRADDGHDVLVPNIKYTDGVIARIESPSA